MKYSDVVVGAHKLLSQAKGEMINTIESHLLKSPEKEYRIKSCYR